MKLFEIKGFWGYISFFFFAVGLLALVIGLPTSFTWVAWNALVGETFHGPFIEFWQAIILTAAVAVAFKIIFHPQISFQIKRVNTPEDLESTLKKLKKQDPTKD